MRSLLPIALLLTTAACSDSLNAEGLGDLPVDDIAYSVSYKGTLQLPRGNVDVRNIVLSDREDLCDAIDGVGLDGISDVFAVAITAASTGSAANVEGNTSFGGLFDESSVTRGLVAARIIERSGGETIRDARSVNTVDLEAVVRGAFNINGTSSSPGGYKLSGNFELPIGADFSNPDAFDVDVTDDEVPDFEGVSGRIEGRFTGAQDCEPLARDLAFGDG